MLTTSYLRERLHYEPETGALIWLERPGLDYGWNARHAGKRAGTVKARGWRELAVDNHTYKTSRIIWQIVTGERPPRLVDHENGNRADDRWVNLRLATGPQNMGNQKRHADGTSGFKGVTRHSGGRWQAQLDSRYLGLFDRPEDAHAAYMAAARDAYGEFARAQ